MRKKLLLLLGLLLIASMMLTACNGNDTEANTGENAGENTGEEVEATDAPEEPDEVMTYSGTVTIWHSLKDIEIEALTAVIAAYNAVQPDVTFELLFVPDDDLRNKYETAAATGEGPDILIGSDDWGAAMFDALLVQDVSDMGDEAFFGTINQAVLAENAYKGAQVGIPYNFKAVILMRNKSIIAEAATDFDDLYTKAMAATTDDIYGALLEIGGFYSYAHIYGQGGELMAEDGTPLFNTPEGVAWLEMVMKFYELGADAWYTDNDVTLFKEGKVGWIIDGTWNITPALEYLGDDFVIDPWPAGMAGFVQAKYVYLNANTTGDIAAAAKDFMKFMVSVEAQTMFADIDSGFLPVTAGVEVADAIRQQAIAAAEGGVPFTATNPAFGVYWGPLDTALQSVVAGTATPEEALQTAEESILAAQEE